MANGMGSLMIGHTGLKASQDAINNVANNLANVNTVGYVRQQVIFRDTSYNSVGYTKNYDKKLTGLGTSIGEIVHARDIFLDKAFRTENGRSSYYTAMFEAVDEVQNYFQELEGTAFQEILTGQTSLWQSFQELAKDPSDTVNQNLVIQKASLFTSRAQTVMRGLANYQRNTNEKISEDIDAINKCAKTIFEMNKEIQGIEVGGREIAMNERDARDNAIDELSKYGNIMYTENANGTVSVSFEGTLMVDGMFYYEIGKHVDRTTDFITPYWPHLSNEEGGHYEFVLDFSQEICTEFDTDIGELKALVQSRGNRISNFNDINNIDPDQYDKTIGLSIMQNTEAEFDNLVHGLVTQINELLSPTKKMDQLIVQNNDGTYSSYSNVYVLDEENCCVGADGKKPPQELFTRTGCERFQKVSAYDTETKKFRDYYIFNPEDVNDSVTYTANGKTYRIYDDNNTKVSVYNYFNEETGMLDDLQSSSQPYMPWNKPGNEKYVLTTINGFDFYVLNENYAYDESKQYTTSEIGINYNLKRQVTNLPYINNEQEIAYDLAQKLATLWDEQSLCINPRYQTQYTYSEYYKEMIGEIGILGSAYESTSESLEDTVYATENQRSGVIGVSSDEELTKMIKYQNAYNASSRYIQTVSDMIEILLNGL